MPGPFGSAGAGIGGISESVGSGREPGSAGFCPDGPAGAALRALPGIAGMTAFTGVFALAAWGMRAPELEEILGAFRRRWNGRRGRPRSEAASKTVTGPPRDDRRQTG